MNVTTIIVRSLLGLVFVVFGLNACLHFIPVPPMPEGSARDFMSALVVSRYFQFVGAVEFVGGGLLLTGRFAPLGFTLLGPVIGNLLGVHLFLDRGGLPMALVISALGLFLLWQYRGNFAGLVRPVRVSQSGGTESKPEAACGESAGRTGETPVNLIKPRTLLGATLAIAAASVACYLYPARLAGQVAARTGAPSIRELQEERLTTLRRLVDLVGQRRREGSGSLAELAAAQRAVAEAELEICATHADRVRVLEQVVADTRMLANQAARLAQTHLASQEVALTTKADLLRAQIRLEQERAQLASELNGSAAERAPAGWTTRPATSSASVNHPSR